MSLCRWCRARPTDRAERAGSFEMPALPHYGRGIGHSCQSTDHKDSQSNEHEHSCCPDSGALNFAPFVPRCPQWKPAILLMLMVQSTLVILATYASCRVCFASLSCVSYLAHFHLCFVLLLANDLLDPCHS